MTSWSCRIKWRDAEQIATEVAEQIASLKSKYPQLKNFSAKQHLRKNTMHDGYNPGSPNNPELYSISYQNGVLSSIPPPTGGPRRATEFNYDPETGIQLNIHFFKGESRGNNLAPHIASAIWEFTFTSKVRRQSQFAARSVKDLRNWVQGLALGTHGRAPSGRADARASRLSRPKLMRHGRSPCTILANETCLD